MKLEMVQRKPGTDTPSPASAPFGLVVIGTGMLPDSRAALETFCSKESAIDSLPSGL